MDASRSRAALTLLGLLLLAGLAPAAGTSLSRTSPPAGTWTATLLDAPPDWRAASAAEPPAAAVPGLPHGPLPPWATRLRPLLCVLDTGIDDRHVDLDDGKVVAWSDFVAGKRRPYDDGGHGTHVAGTAAGAGEADPAHPGAAPRARLAVGKVLDAAGRGTAAEAAQGIAWCIAQGAVVINLSLEESDCAGEPVLADAVRLARERDVLLVATAGNHGEGACSVHPPGRLGAAFTVGALAGSGLDAPGVAGWSSRGDGPAVKPDVVAPGVGIRAAAAGTTRGLRAMDGTSMAAPYVAGVAALLRAAHPEANVGTIAEALRASARDGGPAGPDAAWGWGAIDPAAALAWLDLRRPSGAAAP